MTVQRLHAAMAPVDILTRVELEETLTSKMDVMLRDRYRGLDSARFPAISGTSPGGTFNLSGGGASDGFIGPEQGDVWMLRRALVSPSVFGDPAKYLLFRGSTPSDPGQYTNRQLLDGMVYTSGVANVSQPAVPASTVAQQNTNSVPVQVVISGGTATSTSVNGIVVGGGDGTYTVPAYGSISVTYSVAPTWVWTSLQTGGLGQNVGVAYNAANKAVFFQPGEQLYAQLIGSTAGVTYILTGEAIRVPAEMKGKVLG
jgi:hypothetical protein